MDNYLITNQHFQDLNPLICGQQYCAPLHSFGPASREYYLLHYVVSGEGIFQADGVNYPVRARECFVIRPNEITFYQADRTNPWHYIWVGFSCAVPFPAIREQRVLRSKKLDSIFCSLPDLKHMEAGRESFLCGKLWELQSVLSRDENAPENRTEEYIRQAVSCMETEYMMDITIAGIAARLHLNRSYFSTMFRQSLGVSPQNYLRNFRLKKAAHFMAELDYTVTQAALSAGYPDVFSFSKMFKRHYGISPTDYKRQNTEPVHV